MDLGDAVCVVTGATEGIGRAVASALGRAGATVALCARTGPRVTSVVEELVADGMHAIGTVCDVADDKSVTTFRAFVEERVGAPDVVVNNAGIGHFARIEDLSLSQFDQTLSVNVRGMFLVTRAFLKGMRARGSGHIVNIASLAGRNGYVGGTAYTASKHAVLGFSKSLMLEVRDDGIRVITICPGSVVTSFFDKAGVALERPEQKLQPEDVADMVVSTLSQPERALVSELDIRPTNP